MSRRSPSLVRLGHLGLAAFVFAAPLALGSGPGPWAQSADPAKPAAASLAKAAPKRPPVPVKVSTLSTRAIPTVLDVVGTAQAIASIPVKTRIDSQIEWVGAEEGDRVKAGQVIFRLDARAIQAQVAQARAVLLRDQAQATLVASDLERTEQLVATKTKSARDLESAKTLVAAQDATIAADRASLENLVVQASYYEIKSPIDGRVGSIPLKPGSSIRAADSTLLATINQLDPIYVSFAVPQSAVTALRTAMKAGDVPVSVVQPGSRRTLTGKVAFIENTLDVTSGTLGVKAAVVNTDEQLLPGEFVQVRVVLQTDPQAIAVPDSAVQLGQAGPFVYVVGTGDTAEVRRVSIDRTIDGSSVISRGLAAGDRVVTDGQLRLFPGASLEIGKTAEGQPETPTPTKSGS
ncbi:efflux RND transporter periplasmic adaptor subunit [Siculibacillus lacustris]|uniref:Efflux RND transporter periplasmic adaptor subunit n=1 Tax=Siculibacillus lacustris TaxID=1549641 RepID=A0A4Q9VIC9_9HYPH|nr:efflux RND transporter periplasmic adaptor subunit [Siculibacillus lacustris]TBW34976.1 efflux RND transporter periplasmic adaptor subunit [Siculibacillus lacustris]